MDPPGPILLPPLSGGEGIAEDLLGPGHPLDQLDGLTVLYVDGGQQYERLHGANPTRVGPAPLVADHDRQRPSDMQTAGLQRVGRHVDRARTALPVRRSSCGQFSVERRSVDN